MFDLRYHIASLTAVLVAIAVGIVIGVAIASGGGVEEATLSFREQRIKELEQRLEAANRSDEQEQATMELMDAAYPTLMADRLTEKGFAILFLGPIDTDVRSAVQKTLIDADAEGGRPVRVIALELPAQVAEIDDLLAGEAALARYVGDAQLSELGKALGHELVDGGDTPLWDLLTGEIVEGLTGSFSPKVDGVVVMRSWLPEETDDPLDLERLSQNDALLRGLLQGLDESGLPVVGVETADASTSESSTLDLFSDLGISTVNDVDKVPGRVALALLLADGVPGHYGVNGSDGVSPPIEPLPVATVAE